MPNGRRQNTAVSARTTWPTEAGSFIIMDTMNWMILYAMLFEFSLLLSKINREALN
jgi:hypothetical protein